MKKVLCLAASLFGLLVIGCSQDQVSVNSCSQNESASLSRNNVYFIGPQHTLGNMIMCRCENTPECEGKVSSWTPIQGLAIRISATNASLITKNVWHVSNDNAVWMLDHSKGWQYRSIQFPSFVPAYDIAVGGPNAEVVYAVGEMINGMNIYKYSNNQWSIVQGDAKNIDVDEYGDVYHVGTNGTVWKLSETEGWIQIGEIENANDIGVGGGVISVTTNDGHVMQYLNGGWVTYQPFESEYVNNNRRATRIDSYGIHTTIGCEDRSMFQIMDNGVFARLKYAHGANLIGGIDVTTMQ